MTNPTQKIKLARAFEYLAFKKGKISFFDDTKSDLRIVDVTQDVLSVFGTISSAEFQPEVDREYKLRVVYRGMLVTFDGLLFDCTEHAGGLCLKFKFPPIGEATERRNSNRLCLEASSGQYILKFKIRGIQSEQTHETEKVIDISTHAIAALVPRRNGQILSDDEVTEVTVLRGNQLIVSTSGTVARIGTGKGSTFAEKLCLVVIKFSEWVQAEPFNLNRRNLTRLKFVHPNAGYVSIPHPLDPNVTISGTILDFHTSGMLIETPNIKLPMFRGLYFKNVQVQLPHHKAFDVDFKSISVRKETQNGEEHLRIGLQITNLSKESTAILASFSQRLMHADLIDVEIADFDEFWHFLFETGFIYGEKRKYLEQNVEFLMDTYRKLLRAPSHLVKTLAFRKRGEIKGHISAIRFFDSSWIIQHLSAKKTDESTSAAATVLRGIITFFRDDQANARTHSGYVLCYYRPNNLYPALIFGAAKEYVNDNKICSIEQLLYCTPEISRCAGSSFELLVTADNVRELTAEVDLIYAEELLLRLGYTKLVRLEDLNVERFLNLSIKREFETLGVIRNRSLFLGDDKHGNKILAVANYASAGMNLSELTNSFRLFEKIIDPQAADQLREQVCAKVFFSYKNVLGVQPVLLASSSAQVPSFFTTTKQYNYWNFDLRYKDKFAESCEHIFSNLKDSVKEFRRKNFTEAA